MNFRVGQKVVCVDARFYEPRLTVIYPVLDAVYTVRGAYSYPLGQMVWLQEIRNGAEYYDRYTGNVMEPPFPSYRFRPVVERKTDISIFKKMLTPTSRELCGNE